MHPIKYVTIPSLWRNCLVWQVGVSVLYFATFFLPRSECWPPPEHWCAPCEQSAERRAVGDWGGQGLRQMRVQSRIATEPRWNPWWTPSSSTWESAFPPRSSVFTTQEPTTVMTPRLCQMTTVPTRSERGEASVGGELTSPAGWLRRDRWASRQQGTASRRDGCTWG